MAWIQAEGSLNIQLGMCSEVLEAFEHHLAGVMDGEEFYQSWLFGWHISESSGSETVLLLSGQMLGGDSKVLVVCLISYQGSTY